MSFIKKEITSALAMLALIACSGENSQQDQRGVASAPKNVSPQPGSSLTSNSVTFVGGHNSGNVRYSLYVGTTEGGDDLVHEEMSSNRSLSVSGLPNRGTIYVRYWTNSGGDPSKWASWSYTDQRYTMNVGGGGSSSGGSSSSSSSSGGSSGSPGRLRVHPTNGAYFQDTSTGKAVFLHGFDHFRALQEYDGQGFSPLNFNSLVSQLKGYNHNFLRLWVWEHFWRKGYGNGQIPLNQVSPNLGPHAYRRTGPGTAIDGKPKFNLQSFNQAYFDRLRQRVITAGRSGIWVSVMLFQGWSIHAFGSQPNSQWLGHPFHANNNMNGINGDQDGDGRGWELHTRTNSGVNAIHDAYVKKVVDTVGDLKNVLYEISNESVATANSGKRHSVNNLKDWSFHMVNLVHSYERQRGYGPHPVGLSSLVRPADNSSFQKNNHLLFGSPADYISPSGGPYGGGDPSWRTNPPAADGKKVVISDSDHILAGTTIPVRTWVWRQFTRGHSINLVDGDPARGHDWVKPIDSVQMQTMARYVAKVDLGRMRPRNSLSSTSYCLADPGQAYIVLQPSGGSSFNLEVQSGTYEYEWFDTSTGKTRASGTTNHATGRTSFSPPTSNPSVLFLKLR